MDIVICGAGEVGRHSAEVLSAMGHDITIIDREAEKLAILDEELDIGNLLGSGTEAEVLIEAGVPEADLFVAATRIDEINLLSGAIAKGLGARKVIARVHHSAYFDERGYAYSEKLGIDHLVCPDHTTATAIAQTLRSPGALAVERFARGKIEIQELAVDPDRRVVGKTLVDMRMPASARVAAISRQGESFMPTGQTRIEAGDVITLIGESGAFEKARSLFHSEPPDRSRIAVMGGTPLGVWLCRALHHRRFTVRLFETDRARCDELAEKLDWITVLHADATGQTILDEEHIEQVDAFVALTHDDEVNILAAARAKSIGVKEAIAVLQRPTYLHLLEHVGIDRAFSPRVTAVTQIQQLLDDTPVKKLASLAAGVADVFEVKVRRPVAGVVNVPLKDVEFPHQCLVAGIQREKQVKVPGAQDRIEVGDTLIIIGPAGLFRALNKMFATT